MLNKLDLEFSGWQTISIAIEDNDTSEGINQWCMDSWLCTIWDS